MFMNLAEYLVITWSISTPRLNALLHLYLEPIKVVVSGRS